MAEIPQQPSQSSKRQREFFAVAIPEMELDDLRKLLRSHFGIACEETDRPYLVRFLSGPPYDECEDSCRAISVMAHDRGKGMRMLVSPHNVKQVLAKFEISEKDFRDAYDLLTKRVEPIRPTPTGSVATAPPAPPSQQPPTTPPKTQAS